MAGARTLHAVPWSSAWHEMPALLQKALEQNPAPQTDPAKLEYILGRIPLGRLAEPEDIVGAILFLASHAADYGARALCVCPCVRLRLLVVHLRGPRGAAGAEASPLSLTRARRAAVTGSTLVVDGGGTSRAMAQ